MNSSMFLDLIEALRITNDLLLSSIARRITALELMLARCSAVVSKLAGHEVCSPSDTICSRDFALCSISLDALSAKRSSCFTWLWSLEWVIVVARTFIVAKTTSQLRCTHAVPKQIFLKLLLLLHRSRLATAHFLLRIVSKAIRLLAIVQLISVSIGCSNVGVVDAGLARLLLWYVSLAPRLVSLTSLSSFVWNGDNQVVKQLVLLVFFGSFRCISSRYLLHDLFGWHCSAIRCCNLPLATAFDLSRLLLQLGLPLLNFRSHLAFHYWCTRNDLCLLKERAATRSNSFHLARAICIRNLLCAC